MPQTTALRRVSTVLVGTLFAVVFAFSGASAAQAASAHGEFAVGAHTATSKATARTIEHAVHSHKSQLPAPLHLATTGPSGADNSPTYAVNVAGENLTVHHASNLFATSERAPPAL